MTKLNVKNALCTIARLHQTPADPATLAHQLGLPPTDALEPDDLLRAAKHLGLKAKLSRTAIERIDVFASHWSGELILVASRVSLAGELAKFDFSWFIPALVKYRKLLGEVLLISFVL